MVSKADLNVKSILTGMLLKTRGQQKRPVACESNILPQWALPRQLIATGRLPSKLGSAPTVQC